ncbi:unnamed protein product [Adineta steineri]|uniref:Uncharacterized protein n=1 Tax=Adineta steineri TaxID=433720 RepID=A0A815A890_9BILA|nr:unnamed protein product [Adineta steineri]CAF1484849.1 unnamed protein product [Adineta steineri]
MSSPNNGTASVETLSEVFRCFICMEKLRDARLCPHCSKLCCYPCIRRWLTDQHHQCPHCRATLHLHELVKCRWIEDVTSQLDTLKINETNKQKGEEKDKCELHKEKLTVYCQSCSKCICHQCALFNGSHVGHSFLPFDDIYKTNLSIVNEHLGKLKRRHVDLICLAQDVERNVENVKIARDERFKEIINIMQTIQSKLDEQFKIKMDALDAQRAQLSSETELIEHSLHDIEHRISTNGKVEVISKQQDLLNTIQTICQKPMINFRTSPISCDFPSEIIPPYDSNIFKITNYSLRRQNVDPIYSQPLHINGLTWRLKVYPDGNGTVRGTHLSVFLELTNGLSETSKYEYRIEMIHYSSKDPTKNCTREFASDFEVGECWGYNKFYSLDALITDGFIDPINDTLIIRFQVRPPTYQQKSRDQQWYIKHLENENLQLNNEIKTLHGKVLSLISKKRSNDNILSTTRSLDENEGEHLTETVVDISEVNEDDDDDDDDDEDDENDDDYMYLKSDQMDSDEDVLAENDVGEEPTSPYNDVLTPAQQSLHQHLSSQSNEQPTARSTVPQVAAAAAKPNSLITDPLTINIIPDENDAEVQNAFNASKYNSTIFSDALPFVIDENVMLANILKRNTNSEQNIVLHPNDNPSNSSILFRPIIQTNTNESITDSSEFLSYHPPPSIQNQPSLNNLMIFNCPTYPSRPSTDHNSQQRRHKNQTAQPITTNDQQKSEQNNIQKK